MEIRMLNPLDAENYRSIRLEALQNSPEAFAASYEDEKHQPVEKHKKRLQSTDSLTFGAFEGAKLVGVITLVKEKLSKLSHRANIVSMYVAPEKRGLGIGKAILKEAIKKADELEEIQQIYLTVVTMNEPAKSLYSSLGFKVFGLDKKALKINNIYFDEEHMVLFLQRY